MPLDKRQEQVTFYTVFGVFALIALAAIAAVAGWLPNSDPEFRRWAWGALGTDVAGAVLLVFKLQFGPRELDVFVNLTFPNGTPPASPIAQCEYQVFDAGNKLVQKGDNAAVHRAAGGWQCRLHLLAGASRAEFARLFLTCEDGSRHGTTLFSLTTHTVDVINRRTQPIEEK